jgi:hypothetical protein
MKFSIRDLFINNFLGDKMKKITIDNSEVSVKDFKKWIKALRSGEFKQTQAVLNDEDGFCCLGVACKLFIKEKDILRCDGYLDGHLPEDQNAPKWLKYINNNFLQKTSIRLSDMNDSDYSFDEIADLLEITYLEKK